VAHVRFPHAAADHHAEQGDAVVLYPNSRRSHRRNHGLRRERNVLRLSATRPRIFIRGSYGRTIEKENEGTL
jgi:hypothetical protein